MKSELSIGNFNEIPEQELQGINGGYLRFVFTIISAAVLEIIEDWDNFKNGLTGQPEEKS